MGNPTPGITKCVSKYTLTATYRNSYPNFDYDEVARRISDDFLTTNQI